MPVSRCCPRRSDESLVLYHMTYRLVSAEQHLPWQALANHHPARRPLQPSVGAPKVLYLEPPGAATSQSNAMAPSALTLTTA